MNHGKRIIPTITFGDGSFLVEPSNAALAQKLNLATQDPHPFHDVTIIGAGPAGLTTAIYTARDGSSVMVIDEGALGGQASTTEKLDNYPGFPDGIGGAGVHFCSTCDGPFYKNKRVVVVGGGNNATDEALSLLRFADHVTMLVRGEQLKASKVAIDNATADERITIRYNTAVTRLAGSEGKLNVVHIQDRRTALPRCCIRMACLSSGALFDALLAGSVSLIALSSKDGEPNFVQLCFLWHYYHKPGTSD